MRSLIPALVLVAAAGCAKTHYVFEMNDGELVAANTKKAQPILATNDYVRYDIYRTVTCGGAKRAFRREHTVQPSYRARLSRRDDVQVQASFPQEATIEAAPSARGAALMSPNVAEGQQVDSQAAAKALLAEVQGNIEKTYWSHEDFGKLAEQADALYSRLPDELKGKLHAAIGLYAIYASNPEEAQKHFVAAKKAGMKDPKSIMPTSWTGRALVEFDMAQGGG